MKRIYTWIGLVSSLLVSLFFIYKRKGKGSKGNLKINRHTQMTEKSFSYKNAIVDEVYVETEVDSDQDGKKDRIYVEVIRPRETEKGLTVPVIYNSSPYNAGLVYPDYYGVDEELYGGAPSFTKDGRYDRYFVERGYAVVNANSIGSKGSDGCPTTGDMNEVLASKAVVDWLNGRAKAFNRSGEEVSPYWTTGSVGMIGLSYEGTLANGVAITGVEGLKTIVPIGSISSWYDYYRANGAVIAPGGYQGDDADRLAWGVLTRENPEVCHCSIEQMKKDQDRLTGNYSHFWEDRNYVTKAAHIRSSVLVVHGLNDMNVKRKQFAQWWEVLKEHQVPRKLWLHQGGHVDPLKEDGEKWLHTLHKWFDYWLYELDNGIMEEASVDVQKQDKTWETLENWPHEQCVEQKIYLGTNEHGDTVLQATKNGLQEQSEKFIDNSSIKAEILVQHPMRKQANRLVYVSPVLKQNIRLSGTPKVSLAASFDQRTANLSVLLVDYGPKRAEIITRGWMDPRNRNSLWISEELVPHNTYTLSWEMEPHEYECKAGHQLGFVIISTDHAYTKRPKQVTEITIFPKQSSITLPFVGMWE